MKTPTSGCCIHCGARLDIAENRPSETGMQGKAFAHLYCVKCLADRPVQHPIVAVEAKSKTIHLSDGTSHTARLVVRNMNGCNEEYGHRLYWQNVAEPQYITPALGLVTSNSFRTEREAIAYGERQFGERPKRLRD